MSNEFFESIVQSEFGGGGDSDDDGWDELFVPEFGSHPRPADARKQRLLLLLLLSLVTAAVHSCYPTERVVRPRLAWEPHLMLLLTECGSSFDRYYRMPLPAFLFLRTLLDPFLQKDAVMAYISCGEEPIHSTIVLHCVLRWLAGASYDDVRLIAGISKPSFFRALHAGLAAIVMCPELEYRFPATNEEINAAARAFAQLSMHHVVRGCVGAMDGYLLRIRAPSPAETGHVRSYYSGHYKCYGISILAVCDHMSRFIHLSVAQPGASSDITAFRGSAVRNSIGRLPLGRYIVGDNGYVCTERVITPFSGAEARVPLNHAFNYYISQLRMRIEMAFGFMTTKWGVLHRRCRLRLRNVGIFMLATSRLHNFVISYRNRGPDTSEIEPVTFDRRVYQQGYLPTRGRQATDCGTTILRDAMVAYIDQNGLRRPAENIARQAAE
eukprot:GHVU01071392.1.p1 GENE.GHVU01071392.1~~GHVU01071392.1.p1  ORF type:complete len:439 (+),score=38.18 GHVU01071392.1:879-2195(+)